MIMFTHTFVRLILDGLQGIKKSICHCTTGNQKSGLGDQDSVEKRELFVGCMVMVTLINDLYLLFIIFLGPVSPLYISLWLLILHNCGSIA